MKKRVRKLIMLSASTAMAAISLVTTTYAWFKLNATAKVENFDFEVISGQGFKVSIDGKNYFGDLDATQIKKAILSSYDPIGYKVLPYDKDGNAKKDVLYKYVDSNYVELSDSEAEREISEVINKIKLFPVTTKNGIVLKDLYNSVSTANSGRFLEFGVYFKSTSDSVSDNQKYDIYLNGFEGEDSDDANNSTILRTLFTSKTTDVKLSADMTAVVNDGVTKSIVNRGPSSADKSVTVYSTNAARISATESVYTHHDEEYFITSDTEFDAEKQYYTKDELTELYLPYEGDDFEDVDNIKYYEYKEAYDSYDVNENSSLIYEINDTEHPSTDLGSYATNYSDTSDMDKYYLYNCDCNAMYTYYNHLRAEDRGLKNKELIYDELPQNIIRALPTRKSSDINKASTPGEASGSAYYPITNVESGAAAKLITFRVWLEGWDADCFDGLSNSIDMRLAFCSKRVY